MRHKDLQYFVIDLQITLKIEDDAPEPASERRPSLADMHRSYSAS